MRKGGGWLKGCVWGGVKAVCMSAYLKMLWLLTVPSLTGRDHHIPHSTCIGYRGGVRGRRHRGDARARRGRDGGGDAGGGAAESGGGGAGAVKKMSMESG